MTVEERLASYLRAMAEAAAALARRDPELERERRAINEELADGA